MELWVIRHGQTQDNFTRTLAGHQPGELSKLGVTQAQKTGKALQKEFFNGSYVSDLNRTRKTFENIFVSLKRCKNMKIFFESLLREKSGGVLEGQSIDLPKKLAQEAKLDIRFFRPQNGECWNDVFERAKTFLSILIVRHIKQNQNIEHLGVCYVTPLSGEKAQTKEEKPKFELDENERDNEKPKLVESKPKLPENKIDEKVKVQEKKPIHRDDKNDQEEEKIHKKKFPNFLNVNNTLEKNIEEASKRKLSDHFLQKKPSLKKKGSLIIEQREKDEDHNIKKILVVAHGGFIMELFNVINYWMTKEPPVYKNSSQNCSINIIYFYCRNTKGRCTDRCPANNDCIKIDILRRNDIKHLI